MMGKIIVKNLKLKCSIGTTAEERGEKQPVSVDITIYTDISIAARSNPIKDTIDYSKLCEDIKKLAENKEFILLEHFSVFIAEYILSSCKCEKVRVKAKKMKALDGADYAAIEASLEKA